MLIRNVMTPNPICCRPSDRLDFVAKLMVKHNCGEIPVCDGTKLVGVITDRDITCRAVAAGKSPSAVAASEVMSKNVVTVTDDQKLDVALGLMDQKLVRRLPVVDRYGAVVGIISHADLIAKTPTLKVARALKTISRKTRKNAAARVF